jgi:hypothetical protein
MRLRSQFDAFLTSNQHETRTDALQQKKKIQEQLSTCLNVVTKTKQTTKTVCIKCVVCTHYLLFSLCRLILCMYKTCVYCPVSVNLWPLCSPSKTDKPLLSLPCIQWWMGSHSYKKLWGEKNSIHKETVQSTMRWIGGEGLWRKCMYSRCECQCFCIGTRLTVKRDVIVTLLLHIRISCVFTLKAQSSFWYRVPLAASD